ncbi:MAG: hypothetical protein IKV75_04055 [Bacteroidales bacterium]|nr:hypothetical protein [Bacteroidales bacterium]
MRNIFVTFAFLGIFALSGAAQNLDPTVEVSREYEGELVEVHKPAFAMAVPDSVTRFALDFDYSVFENPYKGSYEFNPYLLPMKPSASDNGESCFYLRAGAGYQPHPVVDMVWSPKFRNKGFNMDVYAHHKSYIGDYFKIAPDNLNYYSVDLTKVPNTSGKGYQKWSGYDLLTNAGVVFRHDWDMLALDYSAGYFGTMQKDREWRRCYNGLDAAVGIQLKPESMESLAFDLDVDYRFGQDVVARSFMYEHLGGLDLMIGPFWVKNQKMSLEFETNFASYTGAYSKMGGDLSITPRYVLRKNRFTADLGLRVAKMITNEHLDEQFFYPDVHLSYVLFPKSMKVYLKATGGGEFETYSSTIASNHHITHLMSLDMLGYRIERVNAVAGLDGRITDKFSYTLRGGYANYASLRHYQVEVVDGPYYSMSYQGCQKWFASLDWLFDLEGIRFDGTVSYDHYWNNSGVYEGAGLCTVAVLKPAALTGDAAVEYNWKQRLVVGVNCEFSDNVRGGFSVIEPGTDVVPVRDIVIRGYADLGLYAEYTTARNLSLWMRAGNLLNQAIQRTPLYAEKGINCTLGICMNL